MRTFFVSDYGAIGDGTTVNTEAIQKALDACHGSGGGRVAIADGTFVTGTLRLHSNTDLHLEPNGTLAASTNGDDYPDNDYDEFVRESAPRATSRCLIYAGNAENISITGMGTIDCKGSHFCDQTTDDKGNTRYVRNTILLPARMIFIMSCTNVRLQDFTMKEMAGGWGCWINDSQYVSADAVKMHCNPGYPNSDGIHINCSCDVTVSNCIIHSGDDSLIVRANTNTLREPRVCERVIVKGCVLSSACNAVRIAWRNDGTIRNCTFSDLVITDSRNGLTIELPNHSNPTDVGSNHSLVENLRFSNIVLDRVSLAPIKIYIHPENMVDGIRDVSFANLASTSAMFPLVVGREDAKIANISFDHCRFTVTDTTRAPYPVFRHVTGLRLSDTTFNA